MLSLEKARSPQSSAYAQRLCEQPPLAREGSLGRKPGSYQKGKPSSPPQQMSKSMSAGDIASAYGQTNPQATRKQLAHSTSFSSPAARSFANGRNIRIVCPEPTSNAIRLPPLDPLEKKSGSRSPKGQDWRNPETMPNHWAEKVDKFDLSLKSAAAKAEMRQIVDGATSPPSGAPDKKKNRPFSPNLEALYKSISAGPTPGSPPLSPEIPDKGRLDRKPDRSRSLPTAAMSKVSPCRYHSNGAELQGTTTTMPLPVESEAVSPHVSFEKSAKPGQPNTVPGTETEVPDADVRKPSKSKVTLKSLVKTVIEQQKPPSAASPSLWKIATKEVQRVITAGRLFVIEGAATHKEAYERLHMGLMNDSESHRVQQLFNRFSHGEEDVDRSLLDHLIIHLGYILQDEEVTKKMADKVSDLSGFDVKELFEFLDLFATAQDGVLRVVFNNRASVLKSSKAPADGEEPVAKGSRKTVRLDKIHLLMRDLQFYTTDNNMDELIVRAGFQDKEYFDYDDIAKVVAAYNVCEGFSDKELNEAQDVFQKAVEQSARGSLSTQELPQALLKFFGVHYIKDLRELWEEVGEALEPADVYGPQPPPVTFREFLVWARRLRNAHIAELSESFIRTTSVDDCTLSLEELKYYIKQAGFSLTFIEMNEFLQACHLRPQQRFGFDEALQFLAMCRKSEGFSAQDREEKIAHFNRFKKEDSGELSTMRLLDLMRHLGYQVTTLDVERFASHVDFNKNGLMDETEYLRLTRLHTEEELENVFDVFHKWVPEGDRLPIDKLHEVLRECKCCPSYCDVYEALFPDVINPIMVDFCFDDFKIIGDKCRTRVMKTMRKRANFSDDEIQVFEGTFKGYDLAGKGFLENKQLSMLLFHSGIPLHTTDHRAQALTMLDTARHSALEAEVPEKDVGSMGSLSVTWSVMPHAWRSITRANERMRVTRLDEAREATKFSVNEVIEFQEIFKIFRERGGASAPVQKVNVNEGRRRSMPELKTGTDPKNLKEPDAIQEEPLSLEKILGLKNTSEQLPFASLKMLLGHLKVKLSAANASALHVQFETITKKEENEDSEEETFIDIPGFLYLMRWMLDTNFANINDISATVAKSAPAVAAPVRETETGPTAPLEPLSPTSPKSGRFLRRASV